MEYLKIAQDLEMYGVSYFAITVSVNYCTLTFQLRSSNIKSTNLNVAFMLVYFSISHFTLTAK